jgi:elongation of very long chain fatty acids protein 4
MIMCRSETITSKNQRRLSKSDSGLGDDVDNAEPPIKVLLESPSTIARYTCVSILAGIIAVWCRFAFINESQVPDETNIVMHNGSLFPIAMTAFYICSLPLLRMFTEHYLSKKVDVKHLIWESMILYNAVQVVLNGWMVYRIIDGLLFRRHSFISGPIYVVNSGAPYAVYVHYCNKYLEYLDTYFMILRGKMDQVRASSQFPMRMRYEFI